MSSKIPSSFTLVLLPKQRLCQGTVFLQLPLLFAGIPIADSGEFWLLVPGKFSVQETQEYC
jgi:hypothetical protein